MSVDEIVKEVSEHIEAAGITCADRRACKALLQHLQKDGKPE